MTSAKQKISICILCLDFLANRALENVGLKISAFANCVISIENVNFLNQTQ